jgi:fatty acid kinase fatty acid binding subunit
VGSFRVVTDSTADVPPDWSDRYGIEVVPLNVLFGKESFRDGVDLNSDQFFARLERSDELPTTSAPAPGDFQSVYERLARECDGVISVHIGSNLSATVEAARLGAAAVESFPVHIVDSGTTGMPVAFLCRVAAERKSLDEAVAAVEARTDKTKILALLDTLRYLEKGGRIGRAQYLVGSLLNFKPIVGLFDGAVQAVDRVRTRRRAIERLADLLRGDLPVESLNVMYSTDPEDAQRLQGELQLELDGIDVGLGRIGAVLGTHVGPRAMGLTYIRS